MNEMIKSNGFKIASLVIAFALVALLSFAAGVGVGSRKALFSCHWGENYARNFMEPLSGKNQLEPFGAPMRRNFEGRDFRNAHGLTGEIISISDSNMVVKDMEGKENTVAVTDRTVIKNKNSDLKLSDLKSGDKIVVMGRPRSDGTIEADLIRVFEELPPSVLNGVQSQPGDIQPIQNNNQ